MGRGEGAGDGADEALDREVTVTSGGAVVPMVPFVKETIAYVVLGLMKPLKKVDMDGEFVIRIGPAKK